MKLLKFLLLPLVLLTLNGCASSKLSNEVKLILVPLTVKKEAKKGPIAIPKKPVSGEQLSLDLRKSELNKSSALNICVKQINGANKLTLLRGGLNDK
jgi:hypothetical protein